MALVLVPFVMYTNGEMATPGQLVQVMAAVLGIPKAAVVQYDRVLAENGLRSKSGRGTSAARVTSGDAANLLMAIAASTLFGLSAKYATDMCKNFASLISVGPTGVQKELSKLGLTTLGSLPDGHSFGKAVSALIESAGKGELSKDHLVWVQLIGPEPSAQISVAPWLFGNYADPRKYKCSVASRRLRGGDLLHTSSISLVTIRALGALVYGGGAQK
jgi:hypothetical protein